MASTRFSASEIAVNAGYRGTVVNLGLINVACVMALGLFDVERNDAKTFSIILFGALTLPLLAGGAIATALTGLNIGELHDRAKRGIHGTHGAPVADERP